MGLYTLYKRRRHAEVGSEKQDMIVSQRAAERKSTEQKIMNVNRNQMKGEMC